VCVIGPYSTDETIEDHLGFRRHGASTHTDIGSQDTRELVIAADPDDVIAWAMVPRPMGIDLMPDGQYGCDSIKED
jgi:hypothetical protein